MKNKKDEKRVRITVKGFLAVETKMLTKFNKVWENLRRFVEKQAKENGCYDGLPCIVFFKDGRTACVTVEDPREEKDE